MVKTDFIQNYCNRGKILLYRSGLNSKYNIHTSIVRELGEGVRDGQWIKKLLRGNMRVTQGRILAQLT